MKEAVEGESIRLEEVEKVGQVVDMEVDSSGTSDDIEWLK